MSEESRKVNIGSRKYTEIIRVDEPGEGGACHCYAVHTVPDKDGLSMGNCAHVNFQNGPVKKAGVNGCHQEDLIAIVIDRLQHFQRGEYSCRENAIALTKLEEAMHWLNHRTAGRVVRGVEGTDKK